jgi:hypothetical protein
VESLGKCYLKNIDEIYDIIEKPLVGQEEYVPMLKPLEWKKKTGNEKLSPPPFLKGKPKGQDPLFKIELSFQKDIPINEEI